MSEIVSSTPIDIAPWPTWPRVFDEEAFNKRIAEVASSAIWTLRKNPKGSIANEIEQRIASQLGVAFAILVSSGTVAVELAVRAVITAERPQVIVPAFGWHATAAAVRRAGGEVRFADVDRATGCLCPRSVRQVATSKTAAIIAVHLHCSMADLGALASVAKSIDARLIEDAAQSHGAAYQAVPAGSFGDIGCFSFNQEKLIPAGEGGAVVTDNADWAEAIFAMRTDGYRLNKDGRLEPQGSVPGYNAAITEFQAVVLEDQMNGHAQWHMARSLMAAELEDQLAKLDGVSLIETSHGTTERAYYEIALIVSDKALGRRTIDQFASELGQLTGMHITRTDTPVMASRLYAPGMEDAESVPPNSQWLYDHIVVMHHRYLLSSQFAQVLIRGLKQLLV